MRVLCRSYDLGDISGSGAAMRTLADALRARGDSVLALDGEIDLEAVEAFTPDVVVAHQWATREGSLWATGLRKPFVMLVHGPGQYEQFMPQCDLVIFDSLELLDLAQPSLGRTPARALRNGDGLDTEGIREALSQVVAQGRRRPTLTLCMTVANEAATLEQAIDSVAPVVDEIVIGVDARSNDDTLAIARRRATHVFVFEETQPPDFPRMRNRAMSLVETDWALVVDGHEWIEHADRIPEALETDAWSIEIQTLYEPDERRVPGLAFPFPRIHRRHVRFAGAPAHEEVNTPMIRRVLRPDIHVWHERKAGVAATTRHAEKSGDELATLRSAWTTDGDRRALFYLANGLRESQRYDEAVAAYATYLERPNFAEEGWQARLYLARCHATDERLLVQHPAGFTILDIGRTYEQSTSEQLRAALAPYQAAPLLRQRRTSATGPAHETGHDRWLRWHTEYIRARLARALGVSAARSGDLLCRHHARVHCSLTHVSVAFSLGNLPIVIRLSGLDRDPGWIPSADRIVSFHYD